MNNKDATNVLVRSALPEDYGEMFTLQRAAYVDEGRLYGTLDVPALNESFSEYTQRVVESKSWVAFEQKRIVGAVCLRTYRGVPDVERLMVAPDRRGEGISSMLLKVVECAAIDAGHRSLQLIVGGLAVDNQQIYEHLGWHRTDSFYTSGYEQVLLHCMTKNLIVSFGT